MSPRKDLDISSTSKPFDAYLTLKHIRQKIENDENFSAAKVILIENFVE